MSPFALRRAAGVLRNGGILAYPTEAVYGLGCDPLNPAAVDRLLVLKGRAAAKGLILIAADFGQLAPFVRLPDKDRMAAIEASWPGPNTWIFEAADATPWWLTGGRDTIAVRVTAHAGAAALCRAFGGALVSTSANRAGLRPARSPLEVRHQLPRGIDLILSGTLGGAARPTRIRDARTGATLRA